MKSDTYTKFVLTVIAVCLVYMCLGGPALMPAVQAQQSAGPWLKGWLTEVGTQRSFSTYPLPVKCEKP